MGFSFIIGNAVVERDGDGGYCVMVADASHPDAPSNGDDSHKTNYRTPGYIVWKEFATAVGIADLFYGPEGKQDGPLLAADPAELKEEHYQIIHVALLDYKAKHPDAVPGYSTRYDSSVHDYVTDPNPNLDGNLDRLMWLDFWIRWALDNCEYPAFHG